MGILELEATMGCGNTIIEIVNSCAQDIKVKHVIPTAHGYHLITIGFAQQLAIRNL